jgi:hypothetical protein
MDAEAIGVTRSTGLVGAVFYHSLAPSAVVTAVPRLLTAFNSASRETHLLRYVITEVGIPETVITERIDGAVLDRLTAVVKDERYVTLDFRERAPSDRRSEMPAQLHLSLIPKRTAAGEGPLEVPFEVRAFFPRRVVTSSDAVVGALSEIANVLRAAYAFIHAGPDDERVQREASAIAATNFFGKPTPKVRKWVERLDHIQMNRNLLGSGRIRGAYWGTFLGAHFVERLGGPGRVKASAPVEKVEPLLSGITYLQLTADVWDYQRRDFPVKLATLERYLEPISLVSVERIPIPRFSRWDRSTRT